MRKIVSRLLIFILTFLVSLSLVSKPAQADIFDWLKAQFGAEDATTNMATSLTQEGVSGEKHVTETTSSLLNVVNLHILGPTEDYSEGVDETSMFRQSVGSGLIGIVGSGIVAMYDPPASSTTYVADLLQNAKIIPQAQAQGLGFASLDPILAAWKNFRNVAYLFFVVIFLVIGFMIMFRAKIGQTAITVQQSIPSVIVALLAVTFSYAIAGFLIDLMYLLMFMLTSLFSEGDSLITGNFFALVGNMFEGFGDNVKTTMEQLISGLLGSGWLSAAVSWLSSLAAMTIIGLAILIGSFKIFFELLKSYISIILQVVLAPVILMTGAIPGKNAFLSWIKSMVGNLLMWPLILICLLVNQMLAAGPYTFNNSEIGGFMPPYLLGRGQAAAFPALVSIGILLVIPEIMKEAKKKLGVEDGIMGSLAGSALQKLKTSQQIIPPLAGGAIGTSKGVISGLRSVPPDSGLGTKFKAVKQHVKAYAGEGVAKGNIVSSKVANVIEGKAFDPNAWENTLVREGQDKRVEQAKESVKKLKDPEAEGSQAPGFEVT